MSELDAIPMDPICPRCDRRHGVEESGDGYEWDCAACGGHLICAIGIDGGEMFPWHRDDGTCGCANEPHTCDLDDDERAELREEQTEAQPSASRPVLYFAHPLGGDLAGNIESAKSWLAFLMKVEPGACFVAPWLACVIAGADDTDPAARERGLLDAEAVLPRCDGIVLCGPRISSGMAREVAVASAHGLRVYSLVGMHTVSMHDGKRSLAAHEVKR